MRVSTLVMCMLAVLVWSATGVLAQGKGKGAIDKANVKEPAAKPNQGQGHPQPEDVKGGKGGGKGGQVEKQTGPQGKKVEQASESAAKGKGKGREKQAQAFQKQLQHEQAKHMERQARLNRIRELAVKKNDAEMIARVDKLIAKEQDVYSRKLQQMQGQSRATQQLPPVSEKSGKAPAGPNEVKAHKEGAAAPGQKDKPTDVNEVKKQQKEAPAAGHEKEKK